MSGKFAIFVAELLNSSFFKLFFINLGLRCKSLSFFKNLLPMELSARLTDEQKEILRNDEQFQLLSMIKRAYYQHYPMEMHISDFQVTHMSQLNEGKDAFLLELNTITLGRVTKLLAKIKQQATALTA